MKKIIFIALSIFLVSFSFACGNSTTQVSNSNSAEPDVKKEAKPVADAEIAVIEMENSDAFGTIKIELYSNIAPKNVARFKELADKKHEIFDEDLQALVTDAAIATENERVKLVSLKVCSETGEVPQSEVVLSIDGEERSDCATGGGPVDAAFKAIESIVDTGTQLQLYSVNNITSGTDAQGEVTVRLQKDERIVNGQGADTDIVIASAKAYINACNKLLQSLDRAHPQAGGV